MNAIVDDSFARDSFNIIDGQFVVFIQFVHLSLVERRLLLLELILAGQEFQTTIYSNFFGSTSITVLQHTAFNLTNYDICSFLFIQCFEIADNDNFLRDQSFEAGFFSYLSMRWNTLKVATYSARELEIWFLHLITQTCSHTK